MVLQISFLSRNRKVRIGETEEKPREVDENYHFKSENFLVCSVVKPKWCREFNHRLSAWFPVLSVVSFQAASWSMDDGLIAHVMYFE